ncbi:hypothetical protein EDD85DRAFT_787879 [Armillaria nabsnona]|nr:hypothetical protein EDD85DRAFT_787879 [Armillaria nabsnona]
MSPVTMKCSEHNTSPSDRARKESLVVNSAWEAERGSQVCALTVIKMRLRPFDPCVMLEHYMSKLQCVFSVPTVLTTEKLEIKTTMWTHAEDEDLGAKASGCGSWIEPKVLCFIAKPKTRYYETISCILSRRLESV